MCLCVLVYVKMYTVSAICMKAWGQRLIKAWLDMYTLHMAARQNGCLNVTKWLVYLCVYCVNIKTAKSKTSTQNPHHSSKA